MIRRATAMAITQKKKKHSGSTHSNPKPASPADSDDTLYNELLAHNEYFKQMINLIPANFYFSQDSKDKLADQENATIEALSNKGNLLQ